LRLLSRQAAVCSSVAFPAGAVGRDFAPAGESLSFVSPKESNQRKGDPTVCVPPLRYGQPAVLGESGGPQNSLRCAPLRQLRPLSRFPLRSSAQPEGTRVNAPWRVLVWGVETGRPWVFHSGRAKRRPVRHAGPSAAMARPTPSGCAEERSVSRIRARSCLSEASSARPRETRAPQVARSFAAGRRQWGRLLLLTFLGETRKVSRPPGRDPANSLSKKQDRCTP
jgi:hypothetical protein